MRPLLTVLLLCLQGIAPAAEFADGVRAYKAGEFEAAARLFTSLADAGDPRARFALGLLHDHGQGMPVDDAQARHWYRLSAEAGYAKARYNLASMLERGEGGDADPQAALELFVAAARQGHADALERLLGMAAEGDTAVRFRLGLMYLHGDGVPSDPNVSRRWLAAAAEAGNAHAWLALGWLNQREGGDASAAAVEAYERAAELGLGDGWYNLGLMYREGDGVGRDLHRANELIRRAAEAGSARAALRLAMMHDLGIDVQADRDTALRWYEAAARGGDPQAMNNLAVLLLDSGSASPQPVSALAWFSTAASLGLDLARDNRSLLLANLSDEQVAAAEALERQWREAGAAQPRR